MTVTFCRILLTCFGSFWLTSLAHAQNGEDDLSQESLPEASRGTDVIEGGHSLDRPSDAPPATTPIETNANTRGAPQTWGDYENEILGETEAVVRITEVPVAPAIEAEEPKHAIFTNFYLGLLGGYSVRVAEGEESEVTDSVNLGMTLGANLVTTFRIAEIFVIGPEMGFYSMQANRLGTALPDRVSAVTIGLYVGLRFPTKIGDGTIVPKLSVSTTFATAFPAGGRVGYGLGLSFRLGLAVWFSEHVGVNCELSADTLRFYRFDSGMVVRRFNEAALRVGPAFQF